MLSKGKISLILGLSLISVASIGFSSWVISVPTDPVTVSGGIVADDEFIDDGTQYSYIKLLEEQEVFKYNKNGFVNDAGYDVRTGSITIKFEIDYDDYKSVNSNSNAFDFEVKLTHSDCGVNLLNNDKYIEMTNNVTLGNLPSKALEPERDNKQYTITIPITGITSKSGKEILSITYQWTIVTFDNTSYNDGTDFTYAEDSFTGYFYKNIYPKIYNGENKLIFAVDAKVTEK